MSSSCPLPPPVPPSPHLRNLVQLELLEMASPALLKRVLDPFETFLTARGVGFEQRLDAVWLRRLHDALAASPQEMPGDLQQLLLDLGDLATRDAYEHAIGLAKDRGLDDLCAVRLSRVDLALRLLAEHRELSQQVRTRTQSVETKRFVEFFGRGAAVLHGHRSNARLLGMGAELGDWFRARNRTGHCEVIATQVGQEVSFVVVHGLPLRNQGVIETDEKRTRKTFVPSKQDVVVYDGTTGRLGVHAQYAREHDLYRRQFGKTFFGDEDHFQAMPVFSGQPLCELGPAALDTHGVPGLLAVGLRELKVRTDDARGNEVWVWRGEDLRSQIASPFGQMALSRGQIVQLELALLLVNRPRPVRVELQLPNHLSFDRRVGEGVVREYLLESGFMQMPAFGLA